MIKSRKKVAICVLMAVFCMWAVTISYNIISEETLLAYLDKVRPGKVGSIIGSLIIASGSNLGLMNFFATLALAFLFFGTIFTEHKEIKQRKYAFILALVLSVLTVAGKCCHVTEDFSQLTYNGTQFLKIFLSGIGYFCIIYALLLALILVCVRCLHSRETTKTRLDCLFEKHIFSFCFFIILLFWIPYIISCYPGIFMGDTRFQLGQMYGIYGFTDHHPVLHTVIMGGLMKFGDLVFRSQSTGLYLYTVLQCLINIVALSYSVKAAAEYNRSWVKYLLLIAYCMLPFYPGYAVYLSKDGLYAPLFLLWIINYILIVRMPGILKNPKRWSAFFALSVALCLTRKNGIYTVVITLVVLLIWQLKNTRDFLLPLFCQIVCTIAVFMLVNQFYFSFLGIEKGSKREMLSIPFQQTARYLRDYPDEVTDDERDAISKVLDIDVIAEIYDPDVSDPVKATFNNDASKADLAAYFRVWFRMLMKHPGTYISAYINNYWGYFFASRPADFIAPKAKNRNVIVRAMNKEEEAFHVYLPKSKLLKRLINVCSLWGLLFLRLPLLWYLHSSAFYNWAILIIIMICRTLKKGRPIMYWLPPLTVLLVTMAGPTNGSFYFRYEYPIAYVFFFLFIKTLEDLDGQNGAQNFNLRGAI